MASDPDGTLPRHSTPMPNRVELARPFAVVDRHGREACWGFTSEAEARAAAARYDVADAHKAPHTVVRLTAERVEEPIPEAKSGWEYAVTGRPFPGAAEDGLHLLVSRDGEPLFSLTRPYHGWKRKVPPCDHAHVAALLKREGVPDA